MKRFLSIALFFSLSYAQKEIGSFRILAKTFIWETPSIKSKKLSPIYDDSFVMMQDSLVNDMVLVSYQGFIGWIPIVRTNMRGIILE